MKPALILGDVGYSGVPVHHAYTQAGAGFIGTGHAGGPFFVNLVAVGNNDFPNGQTVTLRLWSRATVNDIWGTDNGIEGFSAHGAFENPSASKKADKLFKLAGFGYATNEYCQNDSAVINFNADEDFSNTGPVPDYTNTAAGGALSFETCDLGGNSQHVRLVIDAKSNVAIGDFPRAGNNFPVKGALILKDAVQYPTAGVPGAGTMFSAAGMPYWVNSSGAQFPMANSGAAKVLCLWDEGGAMKGGSGVQGIYKNGTGDYTITFTQSFPNADSFFPMFFGQAVRYQFAACTPNSIRVQTLNSTTFQDFHRNYMAVFG